MCPLLTNCAPGYQLFTSLVDNSTSARDHVNNLDKYRFMGWTVGQDEWLFVEFLVSLNNLVIHVVVE